MKAIVVGGGVVGLTTALQLQRELRNLQLSIIAADYDDVVSQVAAGIFRVGSSYSGPTEEITREWVKNSYEYYENIGKSAEAAYAGVTSISGYVFGNSAKTVKLPLMEGLLPIYRQARQEEHDLVGGNWKYGSFLQTLLTNCNLHLPWARQKLREAGVSVEVRKLTSLRELTKDYDLIINCTGLGARELCNDRNLIPIRGQLIQVQAPWIKTFFYGELETYIIPSFNGVVNLGGSRHFESENMSVCSYELAAIRERCERLVPVLKPAKFLRNKVGLRPYRQNNVRVESEFITDGTSRAVLVHNYGHGGYGVCTAPGTAMYAVKLAVDMQRRSSSKL